LTDLSIFYPYPGTALYFKAQEQGLFDPHALEYKRERHFVALRLPGFSEGQILMQFILINYKVFQDRWSFVWRLNDVLKRTSLVYPALAPFYAALRSSIKFLFKTKHPSTIN
jgi:hypothetical protein